MKKEIIANTFTPIYDNIEDRIRLIVNYKDINNRVDFMITRSFIVKLLPMLEEYLEKNFSTFLNKEVEKTTGEKSYTTKTDQEYVDLTLKEELLKQIDLSLINDKENVLMILSSDSFVSKSVLNKEMLEAFINSLKKSIPKYDWGIFL